jgi:hypothetical protein
VRPYGNRATKEEHKNAKNRDSSIKAQLAATIQMAKYQRRSRHFGGLECLDAIYCLRDMYY